MPEERIDWEAMAKAIEQRPPPSGINWEARSRPPTEAEKFREEIARRHQTLGQLGGADNMAPLPINQGPDGAADVSDVAIASLAEDPKAQIRWYSKQMGIPETRFGVAEGQIFYVRENGRLQAVAPAESFTHRAAKGLGPTIPAAGGMVGGIAGAVTAGPPGAIAGGAGGAYGAQTLRDVAAEKLMGQDFEYSRSLREGGLDLAGGMVGALIGRGMSRAAASRAGKHMIHLAKNKGMAAADALQETVETLNKKYGTKFQLTPAELTDHARLRSQQLALGNRPEFSQEIEEFQALRGDEAEKIVRQYLDEVSHIDDADRAGRMLSGSADDALRAGRQARADQGGPVFREAFDAAEEAGGVDATPVLKEIDNQSKMAGKAARAALSRIRKELVDESTGQPKILTNLEEIQERFKETLSDEIGELIKRGKNKAAGRLVRVRDALINSIDTQIPKYKEALALWTELSKDVDEAAGGLLPKLAKATAKDFEYMGGKFLAKSSPSEIARVRSHIIATEGGQDAWDATLRGYLSDQWSAAGKQYKSSPSRPAVTKYARPVAFWANLMGDLNQQRRLKAAMTPDQWKALQIITDAFEASGRALNFNSTTVAQALGDKEIAGGLAAKAAKAAGGIVSLAPLAGMGDAVSNFLTGGGQKRLLDIITNPGAIDALMKIAKSQTKRDVVGFVIGRGLSAAQTAGRAALSEPNDITPTQY